MKHINYMYKLSANVYADNGADSTRISDSCSSAFLSQEVH